MKRRADKKGAIDTSMATFRDHATDALARIETHVDTILVRQAEDREAVLRMAAGMKEALDKHIDQDTTTFTKIQDQQSRFSRFMYWVLGGLAILQFGVATAAATGILRF